MDVKKLCFGLVASSLLLSGCGQKQTQDNTFVVGMECNYAPFNWQSNNESETSVSLDGAGYADGYDVMMARKIADSLGRTLVIKKIAWDGLQPALQSGTIDAIIAGMTANDDRENGIDFTTPYYESEMALIVRKDDTCSQYTNIQQFGGKVVVGQKNTNYDTVIDQIKNVKHMTPKQSYPEMVLSLQQKEADAITAELPVAKGIIETNPDLTYITFEKGKGFEIDTSVSIGLKEGSRNTEEFKKVQDALDKIDQADRESMMEYARSHVPANME